MLDSSFSCMLAVVFSLLTQLSRKHEALMFIVPNFSSGGGFVRRVFCVFLIIIYTRMLWMTSAA